MTKFIIGLLIGGGVVLLLMRKRNSSAIAPLNGGTRNPNQEKIEQRRQNLDKVLELAGQKGEISNNDVEQALGVSDATAERYLQELESQGRLEQVGGAGRAVSYKLK